MRIFKRGKYYSYEFVFRGTLYKRSTKTSNRRAAQEIASTFHAALARGEAGIFERKKAPGFTAAMNAFLAWSELQHSEHPSTTERYRYSSLPLKANFGDRRLDSIGAADAEDYKRKRSAATGKGDKPLRPATVNRELACLRAMFNHASKEHPDLRNPISKTSGVRLLAENNQQERVVTYGEEELYLRHATVTLREVATLIVELGMRPEEVFELRGTEVDFDTGRLRIVSGKTKAARRTLAITPRARAVLERRLHGVKDADRAVYIFPCARDADRPLPGLQSAHSRALRDSKVATFRLYDLRHTFATRAAQGGMDLVTLAAVLGHSRLQMVLRYAHPAQDHQASAMEKITQYKEEQRTREDERRRQEQETDRRGMFIVRRPA